MDIERGKIYVIFSIFWKFLIRIISSMFPFNLKIIKIIQNRFYYNI